MVEAASRLVPWVPYIGGNSIAKYFPEVVSRLRLEEREALVPYYIGIFGIYYTYLKSQYLKSSIFSETLLVILAYWQKVILLSLLNFVSSYIGGRQ